MLQGCGAVVDRGLSMRALLCARLTTDSSSLPPFSLHHNLIPITGSRHLLHTHTRPNLLRLLLRLLHLQRLPRPNLLQHERTPAVRPALGSFGPIGAHLSIFIGTSDIGKQKQLVECREEDSGGGEARVS